MCPLMSNLYNKGMMYRCQDYCLDICSAEQMILLNIGHLQKGVLMA